MSMVYLVPCPLDPAFPLVPKLCLGTPVRETPFRGQAVCAGLPQRETEFRDLGFPNGVWEPGERLPAAGIMRSAPGRPALPPAAGRAIPPAAARRGTRSARGTVRPPPAG